VVASFAETTGTGLQVRYVCQENQGAPAARNRGLLESTGEFIQFLDSDDLLHPDKLSAQVDVMCREPDVRYVFSAWEMSRLEHETAGFHWWREDFNPDRDNLRDLLLGADSGQVMPLHTANGLYRRSLCVRIGPWDTEQKCLQPRLYNLHVLLLDVPYRYLPDVHLSVRAHPGDRISRHYADPEFLADSWSTYRKMRRLLEDAGMFGRRQRWLLCRIYYHLARPALIAGATQLGMELLDEGIAAAPPSAARLKLLLTRLLYRVLGNAGANRLFDIKMRLTGAMRHGRRSSPPESC
jgi:glycosyltransferase involved in cell wall biosynthesis